DVKVKWLPQIGLRLDSNPSKDRTKAILILFARLPRKVRHDAGEMGGVLSGTAPNFEHESSLRQDLRKHLRNGFSVALSRRAREPPIIRGVQIFEPHARYIPRLARVTRAASARAIVTSQHRQGVTLTHLSVAVPCRSIPECLSSRCIVPPGLSS